MHSRADTHVHTYYSGITNYKALRFPEAIIRPEEQVDHARANGMSVLCITDHDAIKGALEAEKYAKKFDDIDVVVGEEITTADGEVLGYWLNDFVPPDLSIEETLDLIHEQDGLAAAPHPFSFYTPCLRERVLDLDLDGLEVINGGHPDNYTNKMAQKVFKEHPGNWAPLSGSDAHSKYTLGYNWTEFEGQGEDDFRKAFMDKRTVACGRPAPPFAQVQWSMEVVIGAQKLLLKALLNKLEPNLDNPLITKMISINDQKKIGGIIGGFFYLIPPVPFISEFLATTWLKKRSYNLIQEIDYKFAVEKEKLYRICVHVPKEYSDMIMGSVDDVMRPQYQRYKRAFSITEGIGTRQQEKGETFYIPQHGRDNMIMEDRIEFVVREKDLKPVLMKLKQVHPYKEPVINVSPTYEWKSII